MMNNVISATAVVVLVLVACSATAVATQGPRSGEDRSRQPAFDSVVFAAKTGVLGEGVAGPESRYPQDDADELYRRARTALNRGNYREAADLFRDLQRRYRDSRYVSQAMYYEAFSLSRLEGDEHLREARALLEDYRERYADGAGAKEAMALYVRIQGELAQQGDAEAAQAVASRAAVLADAGREGAGGEPAQEDDDIRMQALMALLNMDAENAMPILRRVLENRSAETTRLRRRAVFLVAQKHGSGREDLLLDVARNDPDQKVREQAVFFLSQVRTPEAVAALDSILRFATERSIQEKAIFALSQHQSDRAGEILRDYAQRKDAPTDLRAQAIQWLGQRGENGPFLRELYTKLDDAELEERLIFALSQTGDQESADMLLTIALDEAASIDLRKAALFWAGQMHQVSARLYDLYDRVGDPEMKAQLIFVYSQQHGDSVAVDKMIDIVRNEVDRELQSKAIFWLGQIDDPRVGQILEEIINR